MKNLKNLGKALSRIEQRSINGGVIQCDASHHCPPRQCCKAIGSAPLSGYCGIPNQGPDNCYPIGEV